MTKQLVKTDAARRALEAARTIDEVKDVRDKAEAIRLYAKQAHLGIAMINDATEIKLRAERKGGDMLNDMKDAGQRQKSGEYQKSQAVTFVPPSLKEIGIEKMQASRMMAVASIPEREFETIIAETKAEEKELTTAAMLKEARKHNGKQKAQQERMAPKFDRLREIEEQGIYIGSMWSFGPRANYAGSADYQGNSIPQIVENAVLLYTEPDGLVVDPMAGSGTTVEVCRVLGRRCLAFDIQPDNATNGVICGDAANLAGLVDDGAADMVFWHPPYWRLKVYSHEPGDISAMPWDGFLQACGRVIREMARILKPGGALVILSGDMVKDARYYPVSRKLATAAEDAGLVDCGTAIKTTVNSTSQIVKGKTIWAELAYSGNLKIEHDTINIFRKV